MVAVRFDRTGLYEYNRKPYQAYDYIVAHVAENVNRSLIFWEKVQKYVENNRGE